MFQLHRFISALEKYHQDCDTVMKEADIFPIEVDLNLPFFNKSTNNNDDDDNDDETHENENNEGNKQQQTADDELLNFTD